LFARILRPTDISQHHLDALNIKILPTCSIDELLPLAPDGSSYIPTLPSVSDTFGSNDSDAIAARRRKDLSERVTELRVENDVAFQTLTRSLPPGTKPPRLAYMRKFWEGLESMSQFWDCSLDDYYERPEPDEHDSQVAKRQRLDVEMPDVSSSNAGLLNAAISNTSDSTGLMNERKQPGTRHESDSADDLDENPMSTARGSSSEHAGSAAAPTTPTVMRYKGRRTGTGRSMPDQFRADTVKAFVEGAVWPFRTSLSPPRMMPVVQFDKLNLPVRQTAAVYRTPNDRTKSRQGWIEGPIMGIQVRSETDFHNETGAAADHKDRLDCMREIGGLLQLAQQRRREGQTESKPGEGKWWTTKKRWGGGPGGEVQNEEGNSDDIEGMEEVLEGEQTGNAKDKAARKNRSKKTQESLWRELRCGRGYWDPKTDYTAIGTDPASEYDTVGKATSPSCATRADCAYRSFWCPRSTIMFRSSRWSYTARTSTI